MKKNKINGLIGTFVLHILLLILLYLVAISKPIQQEEGGVPVMMGAVDLSQGTADPYTLTDVDVLTEPEPVTPAQPEVANPEPAVPEVQPETDVITQEEEPSLEVKKKEAAPKTKPKKEEPKKKVTPKKDIQPKPVVKPIEKKPKEPTEAQKKAEAERIAAQKKAEAERIAAQKKAAEEKAAAEAAARKIAGAFGKGSQMGSKGTANKGEGLQGRANGNSANGGMVGAGGYGDFNLNGRSLGKGGLPRPVYNVQEEGRVVVTIKVNPAGAVIDTRIHKNTNTASPKLRKAAEDAARKARFNEVTGVNNQTGTITYYFKLN